MSSPGIEARGALSADILAIGVDDFVSMADVQQLINDGGLAESAAARQKLVVGTIRSLLEEGLIEVGVIPSPSNPGFKTWPGTVDEVMARFVEQYDDRNAWAYKIWLNLTAEGHRASNDHEIPIVGEDDPGRDARATSSTERCQYRY